MYKVGIVWFRNNLRLHDNKALLKAIQVCEYIIPVYVFEDSLYTSNIFGFKKVDSYRAQFILQAVQNLKDNLQKINGNLFIAYGSTATIISNLVKEHNATHIFYNDEYATEEEADVYDVKSKCNKNINFIGVETQTLIDTDNLPFAINQIPEVFTAFRNKIEKYSTVPFAEDAPTNITICTTVTNWGSLPTLAQLGLEPKLVHNQAAFAEQGGESAALAFLKKYIWEQKLPATYFDTRNGLLGTAYSTKLSAWLACGCISARYIWQEVQKFEQAVVKNKSTYWIFFELLWRDFFRLQFLKNNKQYFLLQGARPDKAVSKTYNKLWLDNWINGTTGNDFVDANMRELKHTGFMSNRGRQNVASYFVHDLKLDWRYGAAYFESILIDYDVYSNYGNWCYVAGVGNDPRQDRYFNTQSQAERYDPQAIYRNMWLAEQ
jgi:deoxyribodipyrimidine photo-lyase